MRFTEIFSIVSCMIWMLPIAAFSQNGTVPFNSDRWVFKNDVEIVEIAGRKAFTGTGYLKNVRFLNGSVEVDAYATERRGFAGIMFRVQSFKEYEWCWFRIHKTNGNIQDGLQYAPVFNGQACWQLYGDKDGIGRIRLPKEKWVHLKLTMQNNVARLYVEDMNNPVMVMDHLQPGIKKGSVGLACLSGGQAYFSNFRYSEDSNDQAEKPVQKMLLPGVITNWQLSPAYSIKSFDEITSFPGDKLTAPGTWMKPEVDPSGLVNISRYLEHKDAKTTDCAILRTLIESETNRIVRMNFGYSDAVMIFLNQQPLFWGNSAWRSRNMAFSGWISYNDAVYLNLEKGRNELLVLVAEAFGGWGFQAKLDAELPVTHGFYH